MALFEDGQAGVSLDDESLFAEADRQESGRPQDEAADSAGPERYRTSESAEAAERTAPAKVGQAGEQQKDRITEQEAKDGGSEDVSRNQNQLQRSYQELRSRFTQTTQELAEIRRQNQALSQQVARMQSAAAVAGNGDPEQAIKQFMANPVEWVAKASAPLLEQKVNESLAGIRRQMQMQEDSVNLNASLLQTAQDFPQAKTEDGRRQVVEKMVEISSRYGDGYLWRKNPSGMLLQAALELWGPPKVIDQQAVNAATETGKAQALAELQNKEQAKSQLTAPQTVNNKDQTTEISEDEKIIQGIFSSLGGGLFE